MIQPTLPLPLQAGIGLRAPHMLGVDSPLSRGPFIDLLAIGETA